MLVCIEHLKDFGGSGGSTLPAGPSRSPLRYSPTERSGSRVSESALAVHARSGKVSPGAEKVRTRRPVEVSEGAGWAVRPWEADESPTSPRSLSPYWLLLVVVGFLLAARFEVMV